MQIRRVAFVVVAAGSALLLSACASIVDQGTMFHETQRRYTRLMRFTDFDKARAFVAPDAREAFRQRTLALRDIRFSDYEIEDVQSGPTTATVTVEYTGYRKSSPIVVTFSEQQQWELANNEWTVRPTLEEHTP